MENINNTSKNHLNIIHASPLIANYLLNFPNFTEIFCSNIFVSKITKETDAADKQSVTPKSPPYQKNTLIGI